MEDYCTLEISDFIIKIDEKEHVFPKKFEDLCISALHGTLPYFFTFSKNGWFSWGPSKDVVSTLCPMGRVALEIRKLNAKQAMLKVREITGACPKFKKDDEAIVPLVGVNNTIIDNLFPFLLYLKSTKTSDAIQIRAEDGSILSLKLKNSTIGENSIEACHLESRLMKRDEVLRTIGMKRTCSFHRNLRKEFQDNLIPRGFCHFAYHGVYPRILAILYGGEVDEEVVLACPGKKNRLKFKLKRKPKPLKPFLRLIRKILRLLHINLDILLDKVTIQIVEIQGECPRRLDNTMQFNFREKSILCPASFDNLFSLFVLNSSKLQDAFLGPCSCPSTRSKIQYKFKE